ncbi:zinc finger BED domain-containing protein 4-like isoform X2 [Ischnura elegans]|uniref:zinc finger BED domain-containing protein 4-like isoform X2 n=1 Tax=Ischnura elegans TaxID=197161 RepID=UPI001ED86D6D|nr:zinc finger BED domain-containing protein 4-like isoform X2 [Ischnura elegans]
MSGQTANGVGGRELKVQLADFAKIISCRSLAGSADLMDCGEKPPTKATAKKGNVGRQKKRRFVGQMGHWPELEDHLAAWMSKRQGSGEAVYMKDLQDHALQWAGENPGKSYRFSAKDGWARKFLRRKGLQLDPSPNSGRFGRGRREASPQKEEEEDILEGKIKVEVDAEEGLSRLTKRRIKKPKMMDQFVTFSDCSELEDEVGREMTDFEMSDDDSSYKDDNEERDDADSMNERTVCFSSFDNQVSWTQMRVPDEVAIQEVNPNLDVYMDNGPCVESTSKVGSDENSMQLVSYSEEAARQQENTDAQILGVSLKEIQEALNERRRLPLEKRKTNSSSVWRHFKRHPLHPNIAICNYCRVPLRTAKGSTSGLHRHALRHQLGQQKAASEEGGEEDQGEVNLQSSDEMMAGDLGSEQMDSEPYPIQVSSVQSLRSSPPPPVLHKELSICQESFAIHKERPPMNKDRSKAITQKVAEMLVMDYQPSSIVQNLGFRNLMAELEPKYSLPSASFFSGQVIPEMYEKMIEKRRKEYEMLIKECKWCSLSVDRWTSRGESSAHLSITCHHFAESSGVSHQFLGVRHLPGKQSGQDIHRTIVSALEEWGFDTSKTQMYVVTDSSRELQAAASSAKIPWTVIQCFSHGMHLVVRGAMDEMPGFADLAQKARDVSHRYNTVEGARKELKQHLKKQLAAKAREDEDKGPDSDPEAKSTEPSGDKDKGAESEAKPTEEKEDDADPEGWELSEGATSHGHWVSEYKMFERLVRLKGAIKTELGAMEMPLKADLELTDDEWRLAEAVVEVLSPLVEALRDFCSSEYPPLSMTIPIVYGMEHMFGKVLQEAGAASPDPKATPSRRSKASTPPPPILPPALFARNLLKGVRSRFPSYKTNRTSLVAMVLDPRYKAVILTEQEVDLVTKMLVDEITETPSAAPAAKPKESSGKEGEGSGSSSQENKRASTSSLLWSAFEEVSKDQPTGSGKKVALYQVKQYLDEPVLSRDCEPLSWWSENREKYDLILPVARKYASIPATQVVGSVVMGDCVTQEMNARKLCLPEAEVRQLVFLHENS